MSIEENKIVYRRLIEETLNRGNLAVADELIATDFVDHAAPSGARRALRATRPRWPDSGTPFRICR